MLVDKYYIDKVSGTTYGAGDGSTTFNLPDLINRFIEGETPNNIMYVDAGLPDITGDFKADAYSSAAARGAFTHTGSSNDPSVANWGATLRTYDFKASRSSSIYGNSTTVQPKALRVPYSIKY